MKKRQIRLKRKEILKHKEKLTTQFFSIVLSDKRSYFLKAVKVDHINFEGRDMRNSKHMFPFDLIDEVILEEVVTDA